MIPGEPNPVEEKARAQGWVPKEEFKGAADRWIDAETFVKRGEEIVPILRERTKHLETKLDEQGRTIKEFAEYAKKTEERAYKRALKEVEERRLKAVKDGDVEAFNAAEKERTDLDSSRVGHGDGRQEESVEMVQFRKDNAWYESDADMTAEADGLGVAYAKRGFTGATLLKKVEDRMKVLYPDKFSNPRRSAAAAVEGGDTDTGIPRKKSERTYENLPAEAKKQCEKYVASGLLTKEQYVKDYEWE